MTSPSIKFESLLSLLLPIFRYPRKTLKYIATATLAIIFFLLYFRFPFLIIAAALITLILITNNSFSVKISTVITITALLCWINSGKYLSGDLTWYYDHFLLLKKLPLTSYLGSRVNQFTIKINEPFYYTISFILSRISDGNTMVLNIFITGWIYLLTGAAFSKMLNSSGLSPAKTMAALTAAMFTGVTFSLTTHLVRQEFASAAFLLCATSLILKETKLAILFGIISITSHESTYIPFSCLLIGYFYQKIEIPSGKTDKIVKIFLLLIFSGIGIYYSTHIAIDNIFQRIRSDGDINPITMSLDALLYIAVFFHAKKSNNELILKLLFIAALYFSFLIGVSATPLAFLRMYFYVDLFRGCEVIYLSVALLRSNYGELMIFPIIIISTMYIELRILVSNFAYYGGGIIGHLLFPIFFI
jgi:EpsG family